MNTKTALKAIVMLTAGMIIITFTINYMLPKVSQAFQSQKQEQKAPNVFKGIVQEKYFQKGEVTTGVGVSPTNGQTVVTSGYTGDKHIVFVNDEDFEIDRKTWLKLEKGDEIQYEKGFFGGMKNIKISGGEKE